MRKVHSTKVLNNKLFAGSGGKSHLGAGEILVIRRTRYDVITSGKRGMKQVLE